VLMISFLGRCRVKRPPYLTERTDATAKSLRHHARGTDSDSAGSDMRVFDNQESDRLLAHFGERKVIEYV
jgi:hypothetical protein